jgi:hypothetical protein
MLLKFQQIYPMEYSLLFDDYQLVVYNIKLLLLAKGIDTLK